ncbi:hypothetical protein K491DRAFT_750832 [Lophiostoma macrostomum CBS 122681]|uniref:TPR-like protein n=1 Tax=Lophiostoma macrostomum CBS 122681 TaxID=1314788 RepID=A0A6A6TPB7_9PLEO|nr:hypothetical protein K491DRAFT_750832 [Lophiostoma macrostomum CBS 122681]
MTTSHIEPYKSNNSLSALIGRTCTSLRLKGISQHTIDKIHSTIRNKAQDQLLWVRLMLIILEHETTEEAILERLEEVPKGDIEGMIALVLEIYNSTLQEEELGELNVILTWLACAARPLSLHEMDAILARLSGRGSKVLSLEKKLCEKYSPLFSLVRDDGISTEMLESPETSSAIARNLTTFIPESTTVKFAHASIMQCFQNNKETIVYRSTAPAIGVSQKEAHVVILRTWVDIFVNPGLNDSLRAASDLYSYAREHWFFHMQESVSAFVNMSEIERSELINLLCAFMNDDITVRRWCHEVPWSFYSESAAKMIVHWVESWFPKEVLESDSVAGRWLSSIITKPAMVFYPLAQLSAIEALQGGGFPLPALSVVAQIRALIADEITLERMTDPLPASVFLQAARGANLEENKVWHRKIAVCMRNADHLDDAVEYFDLAIKKDPSYVEARNGLAFTYYRKKCFHRAIELETGNVTMIVERMKNITKEEDTDALKHELSRSLEGLARNYQELGDHQLTLRYWRLASRTKEMTEWGVSSYLKFLAQNHKDICWEDVMHLLHALEEKKANEAQTRLSVHLCQEYYVADHLEDLHFIAAHAVKETNSLGWLMKIYDDAISTAKSHMAVLKLKVALIQLYKDFIESPKEAEPLIEEVAEIARLDLESTVTEMWHWKRYVAQDHYRICIRKAVEAGLESEESHCLLQRLSSFCGSGVWPFAMWSKIMYAEQGPVFLSLLLRLTGRIEEAVENLRPYMVECFDLVLSEDKKYHDAGLICLAKAFMALGQMEEFMDFATLVWGESHWKCYGCGCCLSDVPRGTVCEYCFEWICDECNPPSGVFKRMQYCLPNHQLIQMTGSQNQASVVSGIITFRNVEMSLEQCLEILRQSWAKVES